MMRKKNKNGQTSYKGFVANILPDGNSLQIIKTPNNNDRQSIGMIFPNVSEFVSFCTSGIINVKMFNTNMPLMMTVNQVQNSSSSSLIAYDPNDDEAIFVMH
jgi:hypothetical protein